MTTLLAVYTSDGCQGRCDAHCYDAKHEGCDCVCGGRNHGVGRAQAIENSQQHFTQMIDEYARKKNLEAYSPFVHDVVRQMELPFAEQINQKAGE